ncbi:hypothetical protein MC885_013401 [Smutsia gigantea]|nr:hypothetical protein MC885_013401 [Smutsia gigantea]
MPPRCVNGISLVCKLNTRATILAATNPKGQYDPCESVSVNIALGSPLLSRFDLILVLLDTKNEDWDRIISSFILENKGYPSKSEKLWSMEKMKAYFCLIRNLQPTLSDVGNQVLLRYYQMQRQTHARLMFRSTVTLEDAVTVVSVMESSMQGGTLLGGVNALHTSFPENPLEQYQRQCELILEKLELYDLLNEELRRLERLQNQCVSQSQPQATEAETIPGSSRNDPGDESKPRTSAQQERNCSKHRSSTARVAEASPLLNPPSHLGPNRSTSRKHSNEHKNSRDDSLDWFDSIAAHQIEPKNTVPIFRSPKTTGGKMALKVSNHKSQGEEKNEPSQRSRLETGQLPAPEEAEAPLRPDSVESNKVKKAAVVSEAALSADEASPVLTHHAPRKLHTLPKERAPELCRNPTRASSQPTGPSHPQPIPVRSPERTLETPRRKRRKPPAQVEEPELGKTESQGPPVAKLAKFTFKQRSRLMHPAEDHSPLSRGTPQTAVQRAGNPQPRAARGAAVPGAEPEKLAGALGNRSSAQRQGEARLRACRQPPGRAGARDPGQRAPEKRAVQPELELGNEPAHFHLTCERGGKEEVSCRNKRGTVHACTLARLADFSFTSSSEAKSESPHPDGEDQKVLRPPPAPTAPGLGRKRETFQPEGSPERLTLSTKSLFTLPELGDEALDFDWDEEMRKKP